MKKRVLSFILALALCFSAGPAACAAVSGLDPGGDTQSNETPVDNPISYRALLISEVHFSSETAWRNEGDVEEIFSMLSEVYGPAGSKYTVRTETDLSRLGIKDAISSTFADADDDDVSLFFIATHGVVSVQSGSNAGALQTVEIPGEEDGLLTLPDLASWLKAVPGKIIVVLGSCGSGAAIISNGSTGSTVQSSESSDEDFSRAVIDCFREADTGLNSRYSLFRAGAFRESKFYVLTAAEHMQKSWGVEGFFTSYNYFPYYFAKGARSTSTGMPADTDHSQVVTLDEMYRYVLEKARGPYYSGGVTYYQNAQVYPEYSAYPLFSATPDSYYTWCEEHQRWEMPPVTISYHPNGGTGDVITDTGHNPYTATILNNDIFTREHYFIGSWNTDETGGGQRYAPGMSATLSQDTDLYAQWIGEDTTVTWIDGDGNAIKTTTVEYGKAPEYTGPTPTKTATEYAVYTFTGWSASPDGYKLNTLPASKGDTSYYAVFSSSAEKYTIFWKYPDGTEIGRTRVEHGQYPSHDDPPPRSSMQLSFAGWSFMPDARPDEVLTELPMVTGSVTYYAIFNPKDALPGDLDRNGTVNVADLNLLLDDYNMSGEDLTGDIDGNGTVNVADLNLLLDNYNKSI